jgi:hypothetical protein
MQDGRHAHGSGATCLSPELAALIRDAEDVNGQDYEDSLCLREETSVSEAQASSRYRSSHAGAAEESECADKSRRTARKENSQSLVVAGAKSTKHHQFTEHSELVPRAKQLTRLRGASSSRETSSAATSQEAGKHRGSVTAARATSGRGHSSRTRESLDSVDAAAAVLAEKFPNVPRIQLPSNSAGKTAFKTYATLHSASLFGRSDVACCWMLAE